MMYWSLIFVVAAASAVHVINPLAQPDYIAPQATGYIYRSDNDGPASLIQLGVPYQQPQAFAPPIPLAAQPLVFEQKPLYTISPTPLPYIAAAPIVEVSEEDDDDDDESGDVEDYSDEGHSDVRHLDGHLGHGHGHEYEKGAGSNYGEESHSAHGEKGSKGYNSKGHHQKGTAGHYGKEHKEGYHGEKGGEKGSHHSEAEAHGKHHEGAESYKGGDHGHKKHSSKGEEITGYHKVFNKDEFKKDHDFYDVADNSGNFNKHGYEKGHHGSKGGANKGGASHESAAEKEGHGKAGFHAKGHHDESHAGHSGEEGDESHYNQSEEFAKKGGSGNEKEYGYADALEEDYDEE